MGSWSEAQKTVKVHLEIDTDKIYDALNTLGVDDSDIDITKDGIDITATILGKRFCDSGCQHQSNGDPGEPPEYDEEFSVEETDFINAFKQFFNVTVDIGEAEEK